MLRIPPSNFDNFKVGDVGNIIYNPGLDPVDKTIITLPDKMDPYLPPVNVDDPSPGSMPPRYGQVDGGAPEWVPVIPNSDFKPEPPEFVIPVDNYIPSNNDGVVQGDGYKLDSSRGTLYGGRFPLLKRRRRRRFFY